MTGSIIERRGKRGVSYRLKYEAPRELGGPRKTIYQTFRGTKKDAEAELRRLLTLVDSGCHVDPSRMTVAQWAEQWLRTHSESVEAKTIESYSDLLRVHVVKQLGATRLQRLTPAAIQRFYSSIERSPRTVQAVHRVLKQCLDDAVRLQVLSRNPAGAVKLPKKKTAVDEAESATINVLDASALAALRKALEGSSIHLLVTLAAASGARRGELLALRWSDIDFQAGTVRIERALELTRAYGVRVKAPKNASSKRTIGLDSSTLGRLAAERARQAEQALALGIPLAKRALVFARDPRQQETPRHPRAVTKEFAKWARRLGYIGFRFHDLRHTHASLLLEAGVPVNAVAARLGHSTPVITLTTYGHVLKRAEEQAVSVAAQFMGTDAEPAAIELEATGAKPVPKLIPRAGGA